MQFNCVLIAILTWQVNCSEELASISLIEPFESRRVSIILFLRPIREEDKECDCSRLKRPDRLILPISIRVTGTEVVWKRVLSMSFSMSHHQPGPDPVLQLQTNTVTSSVTPQSTTYVPYHQDEKPSKKKYVE